MTPQATYKTLGKAATDPHLNTRLMIPRYLGMVSCNDLGGDRFEVSLGYARRNRRNLIADSSALSLLTELRHPTTPSMLASKLNRDPNEIMDLCGRLGRGRILYELKSAPDKMARYDRHLLFQHLTGNDPIESQDRIGRARIALWGCGGIGNWVSTGLIGAGFKELRLFDFDTIELSNLTRQMLFTEADLGKSKVVTAAARLSAMNSDTIVTAIETKVEGVDEMLNTMADIDFLVVSADKPMEIHEWADAVCHRLGIPYLTAGYVDGVGIVGPTVKHSETYCLMCSDAEDCAPSHRHRASFNAAYQAPSFGPINALVSALAVAEVVKYIGGFGEVQTRNRMLNIDICTLQLSYADKPRNPHCTRCGTASTQHDDFSV